MEEWGWVYGHKRCRIFQVAFYCLLKHCNKSGTNTFFTFVASHKKSNESKQSHTHQQLDTGFKPLWLEDKTIPSQCELPGFTMHHTPHQYTSCSQLLCPPCLLAPGDGLLPCIPVYQTPMQPSCTTKHLNSYDEHETQMVQSGFREHIISGN